MRVVVKDKDLELGNITIGITKQSYNLENGLSERNLSITNSFKLPKTTINRDIFSSPESLNSNNRSFETFYKAKIIDDAILLNGLGILKESARDYDFQVVDKVKDFFNLLDLDLRFIDTQDSDFTYNITSYNALDNPNSTVWIWSGASFHVDKDISKTIFASGLANRKIRYSRPFFSVEQLITRILAQKGWIIDTSFLSNDIIMRTILSSNAKDFFLTSYQQTINRTENIVTTFNLDNLDINDFEFDVSTTSTTIDIGGTKTAFRLRGNIQVDSDFMILFKANSGGIDPDQATQVFNISVGTTFLDIKTIPFQTDDSTNDISIEIQGTGKFIFKNTLLYTLVSETDLGSMSGDPLIGYRVKAHDNLPDISQLDLMKTIWQMFGIIFNVDSFRQFIDIFFFNDLNKFNSLDWTDKFIEDTESIKGIFNGYAQVNRLRYTNDDIFLKSLGGSEFIVDNDTIKDVATIIEIPFSASNEVEIDGFLFADIKVYDDTGRITTTENRICVHYTPSGESVTVAKFNDLDFSTLKNEFYGNLFPCLNRIRIVEAELNLTKSDVLGFNFRLVVYIDFFKKYFLVLKINNFQSNRTTKVTLLQFC